MGQLPFIFFLLLLLKDLKNFIKMHVMENKFSWESIIGMILAFSGAVMTLNAILVAWLL